VVVSSVVTFFTSTDHRFNQMEQENSILARKYEVERNISAQRLKEIEKLNNASAGNLAPIDQRNSENFFPAEDDLKQENERLQQECQELSRSLEEKENHSRALQSILDTYKERVIQSGNNDNYGMNESPKFIAMNGEITQLRKINRELQEKVEQAALAEQMKRNQAEERLALKEKIDDLETTAISFKDQLGKKNNEITNLNLRIHEFDETKKIMLARIQELEENSKEIEKLKNQIEALEKDNNSQSIGINQLSFQLKKFEEDLKEAKGNINVKDRKINELETTINSLNEKLKTAELVEGNIDTDSRIREIENELQLAKEENAALKQKFTELNSNAIKPDHQEADHQDPNTDHQDADHQDLSADHEEFVKAIQQLMKEKSELEKSVQILERQVEPLEQELNRIKKEQSNEAVNLIQKIGEKEVHFTQMERHYIERLTLTEKERDDLLLNVKFNQSSPNDDLNLKMKETLLITLQSNYEETINKNEELRQQMQSYEPMVNAMLEELQQLRAEKQAQQLHAEKQDQQQDQQ